MNPSSEHTLYPIECIQTPRGWEYSLIEHDAWLFRSRKYGRKSSAIQSCKAFLAMTQNIGCAYGLTSDSEGQEERLEPLIVTESNEGWEYRWVEHGAWVIKSRPWINRLAAIRAAHAMLKVAHQTGYYRSLMLDVDRDNPGYEQTR